MVEPSTLMLGFQMLGFHQAMPTRSQLFVCELTAEAQMSGLQRVVGALSFATPTLACRLDRPTPGALFRPDEYAPAAVATPAGPQPLARLEAHRERVAAYSAPDGDAAAVTIDVAGQSRDDPVDEALAPFAGRW
jgi:hypothetical protein